jgi:hypothetical protein
MYRTLLALALTLALGGTAQAQLIGKPLFRVPGVVNYGSLGTIIACAQTADVPASATVEIYDSTGATIATGTTPAISGEQSHNFGTRGPNGLHVNTDFGRAPTNNLAKGSAKIFSTSKNVMCSALVVDLSNSPPTSMVSLQVVAGTKQK